MRRFPEWMLSCVIGLTALSIAAAHAPPVLRRFVLFNAAYGAIAGWGMARLARLTGCPSTRSIPWIAAALILAGQLGMTFAHFRRESASIAREMQPGVAQAAFARQMMESATAPEDEQARARFDKMLRDVRDAEEESRRRLAEQLLFTSYLKIRVKPLGTWPSPWPELFWLGEILVGCAVGTWVFRRASRGVDEGPVKTAI